MYYSLFGQLGLNFVCQLIAKVADFSRRIRLGQPFAKKPVIQRLTILSFGFLLACEVTPSFVTYRWLAFATPIEITLKQNGEHKQILDEIKAELAYLHNRYHSWRENAWLTNANQMFARNEPVQANALDIELITLSQALQRQTHGLFDVGIGKLVSAWGFQNDVIDGRLPERTKLATWRKQRPSVLAINIDGNRLTAEQPGVALDFGGLLKGWALDKIKQILLRHRIRHALINFGGNVLAMGRRHHRRWRVAVKHPRRPNDTILNLALNDGEAIGTSGDYENFFERDGKRYHHIIDPRTAEPVSAEVQSVTVLIPASAQAGVYSDVMSKPLFITSKQHWLALAQTLGIDYALRVDNGQISMTPALQARVTANMSE